MADEKPQASVLAEAMLFLGGRPITHELFHAIDNQMDEPALAQIVGTLNAKYRRQRRPYLIEWHDGGWWLKIDKQVADWLRERLRPDRGIKLGTLQLAVLALVAYRQPIHRSAIEAATHTDAGPALRRLLRLKFIVQSPAKEQDPSFTTTPRFLEAFRIDSIADLPKLEDLEAPAQSTK